MLYRLSKNKLSSIIWFVLCVAISLSCLLPYLFHPERNGQYAETFSSSLLGDLSKSNRYPDLINETLSKGHNPFLYSVSTVHHRIPLRLPMPPAWISFVLLLFAGQQLLHGHKQRRENEIAYLNHYIIRYIHDQDGETYHPFLF